MDKESYSLIGIRDQILKGNSKAKEPTERIGIPQVELDRKCINCNSNTTGEKGSLLQAFKMACLHYKSSGAAP